MEANSTYTVHVSEKAEIYELMDDNNEQMFETLGSTQSCMKQLVIHLADKHSCLTAV